MKLLREFFRLRMAGLRAASSRGVDASRGFRVTVPAPLARPAGESAVVIDLQRAVSARTIAVRREPASSIETPRQRRLGAGR